MVYGLGLGLVGSHQFLGQNVDCRDLHVSIGIDYGIRDICRVFLNTDQKLRDIGTFCRAICAICQFQYR